MPTIAAPTAARSRPICHSAEESRPWLCQVRDRREGLAPERAAAARRIRAAVAAHPFMVAGTNRFCTGVMESFGERAFVKTGAEGVFCAAFPESGFGVALKIDDGGTRASEAVMATVAERMLGDASRKVLARWANRRNPQSQWLAGRQRHCGGEGLTGATSRTCERFRRRLPPKPPPGRHSLPGPPIFLKMGEVWRPRVSGRVRAGARCAAKNPRMADHPRGLISSVAQSVENQAASPVISLPVF